MKLAKVLVKAREDAGLSQADLAERLKVAPSTIAGWELGTHSIRGKRLKQVAKVLNIPAAELLEAYAA